MMEYNLAIPYFLFIIGDLYWDIYVITSYKMHINRKEVLFISLPVLRRLINDKLILVLDSSSK